MHADKTCNDREYGAWNPGVRSGIPQRFRPLVSMCRPENCAVAYDLLVERAEFTGLEVEELVIFRPERLALHSLLIRVTANLSVAVGERYEDLGINFRAIVARLDEGYLQPLLPEIRELHVRTAHELRAIIDAELETLLAPPVVAPQSEPGALARWLPWRRKEPPRIVKSRAELEAEALAALAVKAGEGASLRERACRSLHKLLSAIATRHGRIVGDRQVLAEIAEGLALNIVASKLIGERIEAGFAETAQALGLRLLPSQRHCVVLNTKGASASGKSTLRPRQEDLVRRLGLDWADFALISPDIWRKYLLDYDGLGEAWRYAGSLSGQELSIVDHKLDLYMASRQQSRRAPHMLIDRFRFDSFQLSAANKGEERLLTRFGDEIFMFFMVTAPEELVQRAWGRGLEVGRFKPVEDLLDHCVEAYTGMPPLFFRWATRHDKRVHYEFLDNSVPKGERPRTIAFGRDGVLNVLSIPGILAVSRFRQIRVSATNPDELWPDDVADCGQFLHQCAERMQRLDFARPSDGLVYASFEAGRLSILRREVFEEETAESSIGQVLQTLDPAPENRDDDIGGEMGGESPVRFAPADAPTLGAWGDVM